MHMARCYDELPAGYSELFTIDLQKDKKLALLVNGLGLLLAVAMVLLGFAIAPPGRALCDQLTENFWLAFVACGALFLYILLHELVHGICMKLFGSGKVKYGFTGLYAYAGCGSYFARGPYIVIALAPILLLGAVLLVLNAVFPSGAAFWVIYIVQICNVSGAAGDIYVTLRFMRLPRDILIRDSGVSMCVYAKT